MKAKKSILIGVICFLFVVILFDGQMALSEVKKGKSKGQLIPVEKKESAPINNGTASVTPIEVPLNLNNFLSDSGGKLYLLYKKGLYYKYNDAGDVWDRIAKKQVSGYIEPQLPGKINHNEIAKDIQSIAIDFNNKEVFYAITNNRNTLEKSIDEGKSWITLGTGLPLNSLLFNIVINPYNTQEIFVLTNVGLYKTNDAGFSWEKTSLYETVYQIIIHPSDKSIYYARTANGLYVSKDSGSTWNRIDDALPKRLVKGKGRTAEKLPVIVKAIAFVNFDKPFLIALTEENGILRSEDNGASWKDFNNGFKKENGAYSIYASNADVYIGSYECVYQLNAADARWNKISFLSGQFVGINGIYPLGKDAGFVITDTSGKITHVDKDFNLIGLNYGVLTHSEILSLKNSKIGGKEKIFAIVKNSNYVDIDNGLYESSDRGRTWNKSLIFQVGYPLPRIFISPHDSNEIWLLTGEFQSDYKTIDGGKSWDKLKLRLKYNNDYISDFIFDPKDKNAKYACAGVNDYSLFKYKYIESSKQGNWMKLKDGAKNLIIAEDDNNKLLIGNGEHLNMSTDGGWTWKDFSKNIEKFISSSNAFFLYPLYFKSGEIIIFISNYHSLWGGNSVLIYSNDLGNNWNILKEMKDSRVSLIYINPIDSNNIFLGSNDGKNKRVVIIQSVDKGRTWKPFCIYTPKKQLDYRDRVNIFLTVAHEGDKTAIYIGTPEGLYKTLDDGLSWELLGGVKNGSIEKANLRIKASK